MRKRSTTKTRSLDLNALAAAIVGEATGEVPPDEGDERNPHAVALGRMGEAKGGPARAKALTPDRRREIALRAVAAR